MEYRGGGEQLSEMFSAMAAENIRVLSKVSEHRK